METRVRPEAGVRDGPAKLATVDIVIPVLNEERALPGCVRTLTAFLTESFPLPWRVTIMDNGSTDGTWPIAEALAAEFEQVHAGRLATAGRGAALKAAWRDSPADIVTYMDVDLSTGLGALLPDGGVAGQRALRDRRGHAPVARRPYPALAEAGGDLTRLQRAAAVRLRGRVQ